MVAAVQSLAFYCFPLLTGLLLHVMRQRDHDSYLLRRQHERGETARSLHDTIGNDLAYLILRIDHAETEGMPADEHEYQQQLDELRDAASRAMGHTHEVIDSLENHPQRPSDPSHEGSHGSKQPRTADSTEVDAAAQRAGLQSLIDEEEARLEAPGFTGDNLLAEPHRPLTPETMRLLAGLLSNLLAELYANIAKHAIRANGTPSASPSTRTPSTSPPATPSHPMTRDSASTATKPSSKHTSAPSKPTPNKPTGSWRLAFQSMAAGKTCIRRPAMSSNRMTRIIRLRHRRRMTTPAGTREGDDDDADHGHRGDGLSQYQRGDNHAHGGVDGEQRADHARRRDTPGQRVHRVGNRDSQHRRGGDDAPLGGRHVRGVTDGYRRSGQRRDRDRQGEPVEPGARLADPVGEERVQAEAHGRARA